MGDLHRHSHILERQFYCPIDNRSTPFLHFSNNFSPPPPRRARKARRKHEIRNPKHETSPNDRNHKPERPYLVAPLDSARGRLRSHKPGRPPPSPRSESSNLEIGNPKQDRMTQTTSPKPRPTPEPFEEVPPRASDLFCISTFGFQIGTPALAK